MRLKNAWFMFKKLATDLAAKGKLVPIGPDLTSNKLGYYYLKFGQDLDKLNQLIIGYDDQGIPLNRSYVDVEDGKPHYYPISIGQVALAIFHAYLDTGSHEHRNHFLRIADWFTANARQDQRLGSYWLTDIPKPEYEVYEPWPSAFTQSRALSVLLRAWQETGQEHYLHHATRALKIFDLDIDHGGVAIRRDRAEIFYEEYVAAVPTRVLDGHMFALFGLYDYVRAVPGTIDGKGAALALRLWQEGINGLAEALPQYDLGYWARFNRCLLDGYPVNDPCTINYLQLVSVQLDVLAQITNDRVLEAYRDKFRSYINWPNIFRMYRHKFVSLRHLKRL